MLKDADLGWHDSQFICPVDGTEIERIAKMGRGNLYCEMVVVKLMIIKYCSF